MQKTKKNFFELLEKIKNEDDKSRFLNAYNFSEKAHEWQIRKNWDDYFLHPLEVALALYDKFWDINLAIAWFLHDSVEDNEEIEMSEVYEKFWDDVWFLVDSVTKNEKWFYELDITFEKKIDKVLYWWMSDIRCFLLKIADRENNLKTLFELKENKQVRIAFETQAIFKPLAEIILFKDWVSVHEVKERFDSFLKENNIKDFLKLKDFLIKDTFDDFTNDTFDAVYNNSSNICWTIKDESVFNSLLKIEDFSESISLESTLHTDEWISEIKFRFKKWEMPNEKNLKLSAWDIYFFN